MHRLGIVDIIGRACRLPGAANCSELWSVLAEGRCTVGEIGDDRWRKSHYFDPRQGERGKSYTFAAGVLDDIWGFDPAVFGLSPREAENMDPQQRVLLQVVWEALEDAGIAPSRLGGAKVGVFVGASSIDWATRRSHDTGSTDPYTMTGSTLSLVANRVSYVFDWHGPSLTIDTACSSGLVALSQALDALQSGSIDTAVVGGVNVLLSPFPFLGFAAARMLAPDGRCRPFDANGQGYVRSEGAVALVLRRREADPIGAGRRYAQVVAAGVNSDGRTSGISLPSAQAQGALLESIYRRAAIDPDDVMFVEAHGTGTRAGDPAEAEAIGRVLGQGRKKALPIGSIKSNIGHLEPAAGLAGVLKALLAFEHGVLPASLHFESPNPAIAFAGLNLSVAAKPIELGSRRPKCAGVSAFGFGGTNAHVILRSPQMEKAAALAPSPSKRPSGRKGPPRSGGAPSGIGLLQLSAQCRPGLTAQALAYREILALRNMQAEADLGPLAAAIVRQRDQMPERLIVAGATAQAQISGLDAFLSNRQAPAVVTGRAVGRDAKVAFVYTGNGSQWAGMGRIAYARNPYFRQRIDSLSRRFEAIAGWSPSGKINDEGLEAEIGRASVAQPLLFVIQAALTDTLREQGLSPDFVLGHSVGEIAAAYASGALSEDQALEVIAARSASQELTRGAGTMAALALPETDARTLIMECGSSGIEIGAINSPKSVTLTGRRAAVEQCAALAAARGLRVKVLDLDYPFHSALVDIAREPLIAALKTLKPRGSSIPFVSTVTGDVLAGDALGADYWWRNVRSPVRFCDGVVRAFGLGARVFIEISPRAILQGYLAECLGEQLKHAALLPSLGHKDDPDHDPIRLTTARALSRGARVDASRAFGLPLDNVRLPLYPWQNKPFAVEITTEATSMLQAGGDHHRYLGWQEHDGQPEWFNHLDTALFPELGDHRIGGQVYVPGAVLAEMALAAATRLLGGEAAEVYDLDILAPLVLPPDSMREVRTRIDEGSRSLQIASRRRLSDESWQVHVEARFGPLSCNPSRCPVPLRDGPGAAIDAREFYAKARKIGLDYGPMFQRLDSVGQADSGDLIVGIAHQKDDPCTRALLDPIALDVAFHGLLLTLLDKRQAEGQGYVPIRFGRVVSYRPGVMVAHARVRVHRIGASTASCDVHLYDEVGGMTGEIIDARFRSSVFIRRRSIRDLSFTTTSEHIPLRPFTRRAELASPADLAARLKAQFEVPAKDDEARLLIEAAARRLALDVLLPLQDGDRVDAEALVELGRITKPALPSLIGLLEAAERSGIVARDGRAWRVTGGFDLPPLDTIIQTVVAEHPEWWPDCALLAAANAAWPARLSLQDGAAADHPYSSSLVEAFSTASPRNTARIARILAAVEMAISSAGRAPSPVRVLELGCGQGALTRPLARLLARHEARLLSLDEDMRAIERLKPYADEQALLDIGSLSELDDTGQHEPFDLIVISEGAGRFARPGDAFAAATLKARPQALLIAPSPEGGIFHDVVFGLDRRGADPSSSRGTPLMSAVLAAGSTDCAERVQDATVDLHISCLPAQSSATLDITSPSPVQFELLTSGGRNDLLADKTGVLLGAKGLRVRLAGRSNPGEPEVHAGGAETGEPRHLIWFPGDDGRAQQQDRLADKLSELRSILLRLGDRACRLWIVAEGALRDQIGHAPGNPVMAGIAAFARTAVNEHPLVDIRVVDFEDGLSIDDMAGRLTALVTGSSAETEIVLGRTGIAALRVAQSTIGSDPSSSSSGDFAAFLDLSHDPMTERLRWRRTSRRKPGPGQIEIEVSATGLNFRDCMWSMGLLPEEALEDGFAGPTLGFECSGRVVGVGSSVSGLRPGQNVIAFAPAAFASHVTVDAGAVALVPETIPLAAAATVPVAFITAYYALEHLARLRADETVLVHGGAGGVGLAALQIAKWRGATVFATAGSVEKRELLKLLGADHVLDSRTLAFADDIMQITDGRGVDVVLNSLAGEAMERSLGIVRPFGRFLELGKRDFYGSTKIGLRPFRRNVSYFGIDADQLLAQKPELSRSLFADLARHLEAGTFVPLSYRMFEAEAVGDAFRLMKQSGHIGKIVVAPPVPAAVPRETADDTFTADRNGVHIVVGGLGGFGLATARWLIERGARSIVLASRSGKPAAQDERSLSLLIETGADITIVACDVADAESVDAMLGRARTLGKIRGIIHAAMVLEDDLIARLTPERIKTVLDPKVAGAANLDRLTRADQLDYFVLYSSVTVLLGNPGQASYVAANGYMEALARARRSSGLPALAVGWGGITDAGYLARNAQVGKAIERRTGNSTFTAEEALSILGSLLAGGDAAPPCVTIAPMSWQASRDQLPLLGKPLFSRLVGAELRNGAAHADKADFAKRISEATEAEARELVCTHLAEEIGRIFRMPASDVAPARSLAELGMDSLMGLELRVAVQQRLGADIPLSAMSGDQTVSEIAARIAGSLRRDGNGEPQVAAFNADLVQQHVASGLEAEKIAPLLREIDRRDTTIGAR